MDIAKGKAEYTVDVKLAKYLGIFNIFDSNATQKFGYNVHRIIIMILGSYIFTIGLSILIGLYYLRNDLIALTYYLSIVMNYLLACYKIAIILYHSKDIWSYLSITSRTFLSYLHYNTKMFTNWRERSIRILCIYNIIFFVANIFWIITPLVLHDTFFTVKLMDGSYSTRRINIFIAFLMISDDMYSNHFNIFFLMEFLSVIGYQYTTIIFDNIIIMVSIALTSHLDIINDGIASLDYECSQNDSNVDNIIHFKKLDVYDDLISIITDHQKVIQKLNDYYIFRYTILTHIFIASMTIIIFCFIAAMSFSQSGIGNSVISVKLLVSLPMFIFQLLIPCYLFGIINEKKDAIIFALYSSNWTEMDMKSKKLVFYAMLINNTVQLKLKFTITRVVNLEMFAKTMNICYTVFSMLVNYTKNKSNSNI